MANPSKTKGTDAENKVRDFFRANGFPHADRLTQAGVNDRGDIRLEDGLRWTIEVKGGQGALNNPHSHLRELKAEMQNNDHMYGAVICKKPGSNDVGNDWVAMMPVETLRKIIYYLGCRDLPID